MNANIERLITRIIESSETLKAEKTCIEKDTVPAYAQSVETMEKFGFEWIPATDPRSKTHKNVERALIAYLEKCTEEEIEESWDETLSAFIEANRDMLSDIFCYAWSYVEMMSVMEKTLYNARVDIRGMYDLDGIYDAAEDFVKSM